MERPLQHGRLSYRNPGGFQTVELNLLGWSALIGAGLVLGALVALLTPAPFWIALVLGVIAVWALLLVLDHRRFLNSKVGLADDRLDPKSGAVVVVRLAELNIEASYDEMLYDDDGETLVQRSIDCRQADAERVRRVMLEHLD